MAAAEYGAVFFTEDGRFTFWNYQDIANRRATPVRSYVVDDLGALSFRYSSDSIRNVWAVTTQAGKAVWGFAYDMANDGVPLTKRGDEYLPAIFTIPWGGVGEFFFLPAPETIAVNPWPIAIIKAGNNPGFWDTEVPRHGRQAYSDTLFRYDATDNSETKFQTRDRVRFTVENTQANSDRAFTIGFVNQNGSSRFRIEGYNVTEEEPKTWIVRDETSIAKYGERVIELKDNPWLHDEWQTRAMLQNIMAKTASPIPVTDNLVLPGDPRIQLGDTIAISDPHGMGETIKVQILGITRELSADAGLTDTYQVEVVVPPREGIWDSDTYGIWDQSFIWA